MKTIEGYSKEKYTNDAVLLAGGGAKALSDFKVDGQDAVLKTATYTGIYCTNTNCRYKILFKGKPKDYNTVWHVKYRLTITCPNYTDYQGIYIVEWWGMKNSLRAYKNFNSIWSYPIYYNTIMMAKDSTVMNDWGHMFGYYQEGNNYASSSYSRTIKIEILEEDNIDITLFSTAYQSNEYPYNNKYGAIASNDSLKDTNINIIDSNHCSQVSNVGATSNGLYESADDNDTYSIRPANSATIAGTYGVRRYSLVALDSSGTYQSLVLNDDGTYTSTNGNGTGTKPLNSNAKFRMNPIIYFYNSGTSVAPGNTVATYALYRNHHSLDMRYGMDYIYSEWAPYTTYRNKSVYIQCSIDSNCEWTPTGRVLTTTPTAGSYYIHIGEITNDYWTPVSGTQSSYIITICEQHPVYYHDGTRLVPWIKEWIKTGDIGILSTLSADYAEFGALKVNGAATFVNEINGNITNSTWAKKSLGCFRVYSDSADWGNWTEGIRLYGSAASGAWSIINFGCDPSATSGSHTNQWAIGRNTSNQLVFLHGTGTTSMVISTDNKVGIGVTTPAHALDINGGIRLSRTNYIKWDTASADGTNLTAASAGIVTHDNFGLKMYTTRGVGAFLWVTHGGEVRLGKGTGPAADSGDWALKTDTNNYVFTKSYLNLGGGNEKNASSPSVVWGTNGSDNYLRTYQTSYLSVGNANKLGGYDAGNFYRKGTYLDTHCEGEKAIVLGSGNDLYAFYSRGGTCTAYELNTTYTEGSEISSDSIKPVTITNKTSTTISELSANVFNGRLGYNQGTVYSGDNYVVYDLALPSTYNYSTTFYWSFGAGSWKPKFMEILISYSEWGDQTYISRYRSLDTPVYGSTAINCNGTSASGTATYGINRIRIVMSKYSRLATFGVAGMNNSGVSSICMSTSVDDRVFRSITPGINGNYDLGASTLKWNRIYANTLYEGTTALSNKYLALSGGAITGTLTVPQLSVTGAANFTQTINGNISGNAVTANSATKLTTARTLWGNSFDGTANLTAALAFKFNSATNIITGARTDGSQVGSIQFNGWGGFNIIVSGNSKLALTGQFSATKIISSEQNFLSEATRVNTGGYWVKNNHKTDDTVTSFERAKFYIDTNWSKDCVVALYEKSSDGTNVTSNSMLYMNTSNLYFTPSTKMSETGNNANGYIVLHTGNASVSGQVVTINGTSVTVPTSGGGTSLTDDQTTALNNLVNGEIKINKISAPSASNGSTYTNGTNGYVLKTNGTTMYWAADTSSTAVRGYKSTANSEFPMCGLASTTNPATTPLPTPTTYTTSYAVLSYAATLNPSLGTITANQFYASSDIALKTNIKPISKTFREFNWKHTGEKSYGLIAQEVEERYPELVHARANGLKTVDYIAALCMIVAKLENRVEELESKLH